MRESENPTSKLFGEAIETDTRINIRFGSVYSKYGGGVTNSFFFDKLNSIDITLDSGQISSVIIPGHPLTGPMAGQPVGLGVSTPTALVHELGHAFGNFKEGIPGILGNTVPYAMKFENSHRALGRFPTYRAEHCALFPKNSC